MAKDKKENESMNDSDEFAVRVGEKIRDIRKLAELNQAEFHELVYPKSCTGSNFEPATKTNRVSHWENGNQEKDALTLKDIYAIAKVARISPSELLNVDIPYKVQERSLADWFKILFVDMPKAKCFEAVEWDTTKEEGFLGDDRCINIKITLPMDLTHDIEGHVTGQKDSVESLQMAICIDALNALKACYPLSAETIEENSIAKINEMETRIKASKNKEWRNYFGPLRESLDKDDIPF